MVVVVCDLFGWALSDVPCASITRSGYNLPPPSGQTQTICCQFLAAAHSSKTEIPFQRPVSSICDWFALSIKLGLKFKSRARLRRRVIALDIRERGWHPSKTQRCIIHPTEVRIYVRYGVRSCTTASVRLPSEFCWCSSCHWHPPLLKKGNLSPGIPVAVAFHPRTLLSYSPRMLSQYLFPEGPAIAGTRACVSFFHCIDIDIWSLSSFHTSHHKCSIRL